MAAAGQAAREKAEKAYTQVEVSIAGLGAAAPTPPQPAPAAAPTVAKATALVAAAPLALAAEVELAAEEVVVRLAGVVAGTAAAAVPVVKVAQGGGWG